MECPVDLTGHCGLRPANFTTIVGKLNKEINAGLADLTSLSLDGAILSRFSVERLRGRRARSRTIASGRLAG
jgi:hypothetical protein